MICGSLVTRKRICGSLGNRIMSIMLNVTRGWRVRSSVRAGMAGQSGFDSLQLHLRRQRKVLARGIGVKNRHKTAPNKRANKGLIVTLHLTRESRTTNCKNKPIDHTRQKSENPNFIDHTRQMSKLWHNFRYTRLLSTNWQNFPAISKAILSYSDN